MTSIIQNTVFKLTLRSEKIIGTFWKKSFDLCFFCVIFVRGSVMSAATPLQDWTTNTDTEALLHTALQQAATIAMAHSN